MAGPRMMLTVLAVAVAGSAWWALAGRTPEPPPLTVSAPAPTAVSAPAATVVVHVSGAVAQPGLVVLGVPARVADAVAAAGGLTAEAAPEGVNLAAPVADGQLIVVPGSAGAAPAAGGPGRVFVNVAGPVELESLPGVGPVLAARIVAHRAEHGPFTVVEDLLDVPGIGEAKLAAMRDLVAVP